MPTKWPKKRRLIGTKMPRIDGPSKSTGKAKYSFDVNRPGMLHGMILRCPLPHAKVKSIDISAAEKMPGVKATLVLAPVGKELYFAGDEVAALAADTEEHAHDALRAIKVEYEPMDYFVREEDALKNPNKKTVPGGGTGNSIPGGKEYSKGNVEDAFKKADAVVTGTYGIAVICHQCLESHGLVAEWGQDGGLTVWASTQATVSVANALAQRFNIPPTKVNCLTPHMGGGYGSKFGPGVEGFTAAELARIANAPVKLLLPRDDEITTAGNRPSVYGTVKIAGTREGRITAFEVDCYGTSGYVGGATVNFGLLPYVYQDSIPNIHRKHDVVRVNAGRAQAMRAPGHPQSCLLTESAVDDLCAKLGLEPMRFRLENLPDNDLAVELAAPLAWGGIRRTVYVDEIQRAARLCGWYEKWHPPGADKGPIKRGIGMALHTWGGNAQGGPPNNEATVIISRDGTVTVESSTQDLGTGQRTISAIVTAEILGLEVADIVVNIGNNRYGHSGGSGGSTTLPSQAPATLRAATAARDDLFAKVAKKVEADPKNLTIEPPSVDAKTKKPVSMKIVDTVTKKSWEWKEFCAKLGMEEAKGKGDWNYDMSTQEENANVSSIQVGGVQVAEVLVDTETGVVKVVHFVAVQDCGMIINKLACESQVAGGVIMGLNYALFEERIMDRATGRQVNPDMEFYKLGGLRDMPKITVEMVDMPERGVIGIGEPPTVSTAAAISNAVFNAIGVRVPIMPLTPQRVLDALAKGGNA
jgi:xanthine dehydrogenase YagR molybdenum-binding subunit